MPSTNILTRAARYLASGAKKSKIISSDVHPEKNVMNLLEHLKGKGIEVKDVPGSSGKKFFEAGKGRAPMEINIDFSI